MMRFSFFDRSAAWAALLLLLLHSSLLVLALDNGVARTPPMGWLSWERYTCEVDCATYPHDCINENLYMRMADMLVDFGYKDVGYEYVNVDDCWQGPRGPNGELTADPKRFPSGMKALGDYIHSRGLKFGIYSDIGPLTCGGYQAFNVTTDATNLRWQNDVKTMASWNIDSLKVDGCYADPSTMAATYPLLGDALNKTGRPIMYSCSWPDYVRISHLPVPYKDLVKYCNLWRNFDDITDSFDSISSIINFWAHNNSDLSPVPQPGAWNDPDMIMVGNTGLSTNQQEIQFGMWAIFAAPLLMSNDLAAVPPTAKAILQNKEVIAVNQDPKGKAGTLVWLDGYHSLWKRDLSDGSVAAALLRLDQFGGPLQMNFTSAALGLSSNNFVVRDLFRQQELGTFSSIFNVAVTTNTIKFYKVTPTN